MGFRQIIVLLCFLLFLYFSFSFASTSTLCPPDQRQALLHFRDSFVRDVEASDSCHLFYPSYPKTKSWNIGMDCCLWDGVTCDNVTGNVVGLDLTCNWLRDANSSLFLPKLEKLLLRSCNLTEFPNFLSSLDGLKHLDLSYNMISGEIPTWFWGISLDTLEELRIPHNLLKRGIHQFHWKRLRFIDLENNLFQGPLPIPPPSTSHFYASNNGFTGEIPSSICQLSSLKVLDLSNNNLSGYMPPCFGDVFNLVHLDMSGNILEGLLPRSLVKCVNLSVLLLGHNKFNDIFPHWLEAPQLYLLDLQSNYFHGGINLTVLGLSFPKLAYLFLSKNNFVGSWPTQDFSNTSLYVIDLSNNKFGGPIPLPSPITVYFSIASNNLVGKIPSLICNATKLEMIDLSNNSLTGSLPQCISNFGDSLSVLDLRMNHLEGIIPQSSSWRNSLTTLDLSQNWFQGKVPTSLDKCDNLEVLDLGDNQIIDEFPKWLGALRQLKVLVLRSNNFTGFLDIPKQADLFPKLHILDLSNNNFGGPLPADVFMNFKAMMNDYDSREASWFMTASFEKSWYNNSILLTFKGLALRYMRIITFFKMIDLSRNSFEREIPRVIGHLRFLFGLNLSHNHLTCSIPPTLGNMKNLESLDVSSNKLCGEIPRMLKHLSFLSSLNLSNNQLIGRIPQGNQLDTFTNDSFSGNPGLCGDPLQKECSLGLSSSTCNCKGHEHHEHYEHWFKQKTIWIGYSSGIVIGISITYIAVEIGKPKWFAQGIRLLERRVANWMEKPKRKAVKFH